MSAWIGCAVGGSPFPGSPGSVSSVLAGSGASTGWLSPVAVTFAVADSVPRLSPGRPRKASVYGAPGAIPVTDQVSSFSGEASVGSSVSTPGPPVSSV